MYNNFVIVPWRMAEMNRKMYVYNRQKKFEEKFQCKYVNDIDFQSLLTQHWRYLVISNDERLHHKFVNIQNF